MTLAELEHLRATIPEDGSLPAATTRDDLAAIQRRRADLDRRLTRAREAQATLAALPLGDDDQTWRDQLTQWRAVLCDELLTIKSPIRDKAIMGRSINLTLSIKCIDFGPQRMLKDSGYGLTTLRLGALLREAGYEPQGVDADSHFLGTMPWHGSLPEVDRRIADLQKKREAAQAALDEALLDDDLRAQREAEAQARRDALNALPTRKVRGDGSQYDRYPDGRRVEVSS